MSRLPAYCDICYTTSRTATGKPTDPLTLCRSACHSKLAISIEGGSIDTKGKLGDTLKLRDYVLTLRSARLRNTHTHPSYQYVVVELEAKERVQRVNSGLSIFGDRVRLETLNEHYFDETVIESHRAPAERGIVVFEVHKSDRYFRFTV